MVRDEIRKLIKKAGKDLGAKLPEFSVERPREREHGDYATNVAFVGAKLLQKTPMELAEMIRSKIKSNIFDKIEITRPGFINFFLSKEYLQKQVSEILKKKVYPVKSSLPSKIVPKAILPGQAGISPKAKLFNRVNVEFISANPTGPLTLGNGRGGFCGDVLSNVLEAIGYNVTREYYINDRGKQIEDLKKGLYKGEKRTVSQIQKENQKVITKKLKIKFDVWFSEKSLYKRKEVDKILNWLKRKKLAYEKEGALWFKSTKFGDDKDRVLVKADEEKTYFASDVAYLKNKFERGFDKLIFFWGADHYGYLDRMKAVVQALGYKKEQTDFIIMQLVRLFEKGKQIRMSKRTGTYVTLEELIDEVGLDVARFFFLTRSAGSHLNFDLSLAKEKSEKNPVYYVQYAHARICSILAKANGFGRRTSKNGRATSKLLVHPSELALIKQLVRFLEIIEDIAKDYQVQRLPNYALDLVGAFHKFYEDCRVISGNKELSSSRLSLLLATQKVLKNTLDLMGISAPSKM